MMMLGKKFFCAYDEGINRNIEKNIENIENREKYRER
jgi:hypothetical protein